MAPSQVLTLALRSPTVAFTEQIMAKFKEELINDQGALVLTPNERSYLKMILKDGYTVSS